MMTMRAFHLKARRSTPFKQLRFRPRDALELVRSFFFFGTLEDSTIERAEQHTLWKDA
jgi:hypothetical protein